MKNKNMINVFCVDIGYSLKRDLAIWNSNPCDYAGHILYGVNHMEENGIHPIFEYGRHKMIYGKWYAFLDEIVKFFSLLTMIRKVDAIWIPHAYYSKWIPILRKLKIIRKPVVVCMHNKNNLRGFIYGCDEIITINPSLYKQLCSTYPDIQNKIHMVPLAPELINIPVEDNIKKTDIISIGNTKRDFSILIDAMKNLPYSCRIITNNYIDHNKLPENVEVLPGGMSYAQCLQQYMSAKVIVVPLSNDVDQGVFGLTSLVDALTIGKPLVITKTEGMGIPIQKWGCGIEVSNSKELTMAIDRLLIDQEYREELERNIIQKKKEFNMNKSGKMLCDLIKQAVNTENDNF